MLSDRTAQFVVVAMTLLAILGLFVPNWVVNQMMFGFSRALSKNFSGVVFTPKSMTSKPAPSIIMATRFLPISCRSP